MKHRRASAFLLAAITGAGVSLSGAPRALSQTVPPCERTATSTPPLTGAALNTAVPVKIGVAFVGSALVLSPGPTGKVISNPLNLSPLGLGATTMVITGARLRTDIDGNVRFFMSSSESPEWVEAHRCDNIAASEEFCVRFPKPAGRSLRWMAILSNSAGAPAIRSVQPVLDYVVDNEHYRGGITVHEGITYFGGFRQPGDLGQMYAFSTDFGTEHWTAREQLNGSSRKIYTANGTQVIEFAAGSAAELAPVLGVTEAQVPPIVNWVRDAPRFGTVGDERRFGGVISSTPVVVARPELPVWFLRADTDRQSDFQTFRRNQINRPPLLLYGAKDGMVHALHTDPRNVADDDMGKEAWAFIPSGVASRMDTDFATNVISAYPDTWPVVDDVLIGGQFATIAVLAHGRGGFGISTIDITNSVQGNAFSGFTVTGPQPLWEQIPQDAAPFGPGMALSRPAVARVEVGTDERYMVIAGTGISYHDPDFVNENGRIVMAYDAESGDVYWKFRTQCPLTTSITVFETDDEGEPEPAPELDGFMDRAVFGDRCGYIYKIDLTQETNGGWTPGVGAISNDVVAGVQLRALFRTDLGRPVTGNIAARAVADDDTSRVALFFGTGGLEEYPPYLQNTFYAIAAAPEDPGDTVLENLVFQRIPGTCLTATACEKFYGGVRVNPQQVIFTRVVEPPIGVGAAACDTQPGSTTVEARSLVGDITTALGEVSFTQSIDSVVTTPPTLAGNAIYFMDGRGRMNSIGDTATGAPSYVPNAQSAARTNAPMLILGWRQVY